MPGLFFNKVADLACNFIKKKTLAQVFSYRTSLVSASDVCQTAASDSSESDESENDHESYNEGIEAVVCRCSSK